MLKSSPRGSRIALVVTALAAGAALAVPATAAALPTAAAADDLPAPALFVTTNGENTDIELVLLDGFTSCAGPVVITGQLSDMGADGWAFEDAAPVPAGHTLVYPTTLDAIDHIDAATPGKSRTTPLPLGAAPHTAVARCAREGRPPVTYIRAINHVPVGPGVDLSQGSLGSLDYFGSLGSLDVLGSLGSVVLQSTGTLGSLGSVNSSS